MSRIVMLAPRYHPFVGGVERHVQFVCRALRRSGQETTVVTPRLLSSRECEVFESSPIYRISVSSRPKVRVLEAFLWFVKRRKQFLSADLFHFHDVDMYRLCALPLRLLFPAKPFFLTFHGYEGFPIPPQAIALRRRVARQVRGSIAIGCGELFEKWYGTHSDYVIPGGVDVPAAKVRGVNKLEAVFVGRLAEDTGIREYLRALIAMRQRGKAYHLRVCGDGPLRGELERLAQENALLVTWHGFVPSASDYLDGASLAFVSGYLSILEAMVRRKPVFSIYTDPFRKDYLHFIPVSSEMVIAGSADELAEEIVLYLSGRRLLDLEKAFDWAARQTWQNVARTYLSLYKGK